MQRNWIAAVLLVTSSLCLGKEEAVGKRASESNVVKIYADRITDEGRFLPARYVSGFAIAKGGMALVAENQKTVVTAKDLVGFTPASSSGNQGLQAFSGGESKNSEAVDECIVMLGNGERVVDFKPAVDEKNEVICREVKVIIQKDGQFQIVNLPDVPLQGLGKAVADAEGG